MKASLCKHLNIACQASIESRKTTVEVWKEPRGDVSEKYDFLVK